MSNISTTSISSLLQRATSSVQHGSLDDALQGLLDELTTVIALDRVLIWQYDASQQEFVPLAGRANGERWTPVRRIPDTRAPIDRLRREHAIVELSGDELADIVEEYSLDAPITPASVLLGPIVSGDTFYGMFSISRGGALPAFSEDEIAIVRSIAGLIGVAVRTAVAVEAERSQRMFSDAVARQQRVLRELTARIESTSGPAAMAEAALSTMVELVDVTVARVSQWDASDPDAPPHLLASHAADGSFETIEAMLEEFERTARDAALLEGSPSHHWDETEAIQRACCTFRINGTTRGIVSVARSSAPALGDAERELLVTITDHLSLGLQRSMADRSRIEARDEARRHATSIGRMLSISHEMTRRHDLEGLYRTMETGLWSLVSHHGHAFYRAAQPGGTLTLLHSGGDRPANGIPEQLDRNHPVIGAVIHKHQAHTGVADDHALLAAPMIIDGEMLGIILLWRNADSPFDGEERSLASIFAAHATSEVRRHQLETQRRDMHIGGIRALASAVDRHDPLTSGHADRVHRLARRIAETMQVPRDEIEYIEVASLLHDIGKIGIPSPILHKPNPLDEHERAIMMGHAQLGADILRDANSEALDPVAVLVQHHHEWWDGRGYPAGLTGDDIPLGAQIIAVADAWDAMTHDRPYQPRLDSETAHRIVTERAGSQFAPAVVDAIDQLHQQGELASSLRSAAPETRVEVPTGDDRLGDIRALGILVELANLTAHLTELPSLLRALAGMLARRLDISLALLLRPEESEPAPVEAITQTPHGYEIFRCEHQSIIDVLLHKPLPAALESLKSLPDEPRITQIFPEPHNTGVVALEFDNSAHGVIVFQPNDPNRAWRFEAPPLQAVSHHVLAAINVARLHAQARADASTDGLTGAANYRGFHRRLNRLLADGSPFSLLMFDVVGLKQLNDTVGHLAGDTLLVQIASSLRDTLPQNATIARIGGDEFGVLVPLALREAQVLGDRVQAAVNDSVAPQYQHAVTVRYGWAIYPEDGVAAETLLGTADQRMYQRLR